MSQINPNYQNCLNSKYVNFKSAEDNVQNYSADVNNLQGDMLLQSATNTINTELPAIYQDVNNIKKPLTFKETVKKYDWFHMFYPWLEHPILMAGTSAATIWGIDKFASSWAGDYDKSLLGKANKLGDKITNAKIFQSKGVKSVFDFFKKGYNKIAEPIRNNSWVRAMVDTPCQPEWKMAKYDLIPQMERIVHDDFTLIVRNLGLGHDKAIPLKNLGIKPSDVEMLKRIFGDNYSKTPQENLVNAVLSHRLGKTDQEIRKAASLGASGLSDLKREIADLMGFKTKELVNLEKADLSKYVDRVFEASKKAKGKVWVSDGSGILKRTVGMDTVHNRMFSLSDASISKLGKNLSLFLQKIHRGFTFGGGYGSMILFIIPHLANTVVDTIKAEPEEKLSTAVQGGIMSIQWVFTIPLAMKTLYALGGLKNIGLSKDVVGKIDQLKADYHAGSFSGTRKELKKQIKNLRKVDNQNLISKMARKIASFFTSDLKVIKSAPNEKILTKIFGGLGNFFKNVGNVPIRFLVAMGIMGLFDGAITKVLNAIFGRTHSEEDLKMHEEEKERQKVFTKEDLRARVVALNQNKVNGVQNASDSKMEIPEYVMQNNINSEISEEEGNNYLAPPMQDSKIKLPENEISKNKQAEKIIEQKVAENNDIPKAENIILDKNIPEVKGDNTVIENNIENLSKDNYNYIPNQSLNPILYEHPVNNQQSNNPVVNNVEQTNIDNYDYIPSSKNEIPKEANNTEKNKYIPSQQAANINVKYDNSGLNGALSRADRAEMQAFEILNGKFRNL